MKLLSPEKHDPVTSIPTSDLRGNMRCLHLFMFIILLLHLNYVCNNPQSPSFPPPPPPIMCVPKVDLSQNYDISVMM